MTEKMTYVKALEFAMSQLDSTVSKEVTDKLESLKAQLEKRAQYKSDKPTKAQREAASFRLDVLTCLGGFEEPVQCGTVATQMGVSGQKVSAALRKLVEDGAVTKTVGKGKVSLFEVIREDEDEEVEG